MVLDEIPQLTYLHKPETKDTGLRIDLVTPARLLHILQQSLCVS